MNQLILLSDSKINLGALVPIVLQSWYNCILVVRDSSTLRNCCKVSVKDEDRHTQSYSLFQTDKESYAEIKAMLEKQAGMVVVMVAGSSACKEMLADKDTKVIITTAREGIIKTYLPLLQEVQHSLQVVSFDNDETLIERAKMLCKNLHNITFHKGIIHCVCPQKHYDPKQRTLEVIADKKRISLIFPPELRDFACYFDDGRSPFERNYIIHACQNYQEYQFLVACKIIMINGIHTFLSILAYTIGYREGKTLSDIAKSKYQDLIPHEKAKIICKEAFSDMYDALLKNFNDSSLALEKTARCSIMQTFVDGLYTQSEIVARGIDVFNEDSLKKLNRHLEMLEMITDQEIVSYIAEFKAILAKIKNNEIA